MPQYSKSSYTLTYKPNNKHTLPPTILLIVLACKQIMPYLYIKCLSEDEHMSLKHVEDN